MKQLSRSVEWGGISCSLGFEAVPLMRFDSLLSRETDNCLMCSSFVAANGERQYTRPDHMEGVVGWCDGAG